MTCEAPLYHSSFYSLVIPMTGSVQPADIQSISITLTSITDQSSDIVFTKSAGEITIGLDGVIRLIIQESKVTSANIFSIKVNAVSTANKAILITPCPSVLEFFNQ